MSLANLTWVIGNSLNIDLTFTMNYNR